MLKAPEIETLPGFVGIFHCEQYDRVTARVSEQSTRHEARAELRRLCQRGETIQAIVPLSLACHLGIEVATAFRPNSQFDLEDIVDVLKANKMSEVAKLGEQVRNKLTQEREERANSAETGPFKLTGSMGAIGDNIYWHQNIPQDAEMVATLMEQVLAQPGLIEVPTANGTPISLRVGIDKGFGHHEGDDTCTIRMYCEEWEYLASEVMPVNEDFFAMVIELAQAEQGRPLAEQIVLATLEYAYVVYRHLAPYLNDEEREAARIQTAVA